MFLPKCRPLLLVLSAAMAAGVAWAQTEMDGHEQSVWSQSSPSPAADAPAQDVVQAYRTNAALADEKYTDKRVAVTGHMKRITGTPLADKPKVIYLLEMAPGTSGFKYYLSFRFTEKDRSELAPLGEGQRVTIEGLCKGLAPQEDTDGRQAVYFWECKVVKAVKVGK